MYRISTLGDTIMETSAVEVIQVSSGNMKNFNYLFVDNRDSTAVIVDPAWEMDKIVGAISKYDALLRGVLITHSHRDHLHLAERVSTEYNCPIWMSTKEIEYSGFRSKALIGIMSGPIGIGNIQIDAILTPGHTPGSICYKIDKNLFTGDVLFAEGCGICRDYEAAFEMFESLQIIKNVTPPDARIYPGHSYGKVPGQLFGNVLKENIYLQFKDKNSFASCRLRFQKNIKSH